MVAHGQFKVEVETALNAFAQATGLGILEASEVLLSANALVAIAKDSRTKEGLARLLVETRDTQCGSLKYLARLWHMTAQAHSIASGLNLSRRFSPWRNPMMKSPTYVIPMTGVTQLKHLLRWRAIGCHRLQPAQ